MRNTDITYRKATVKDAQKLARYRVDFLNEVYKTNDDVVSKALYNELVIYFNQSFEENSLISWIAEHEQKIISTSGLVVWKIPLSFASLGKHGRRGYILNMFTLKAYRKKGIASVLMNKLVDEAKQLNLEYLHLHTTDDGIRIYKKLGFNEPEIPELKLILNDDKSII
jgi:GNAT superfamily N-acetyltransferase